MFGGESQQKLESCHFECPFLKGEYGLAKAAASLSKAASKQLNSINIGNADKIVRLEGSWRLQDSSIGLIKQP
jgi:hypothetical protein